MALSKIVKADYQPRRAYDKTVQLQLYQSHTALHCMICSRNAPSIWYLDHSIWYNTSLTFEGTTERAIEGTFFEGTERKREKLTRKCVEQREGEVREMNS